MAISLTWLGHSAFHVTIGEYHILIDPHISGNALAPVSADELPADFILLSHGHDDHVGDTVDIAHRTGATVVANNEIAIWCRDKHNIKNVHTLNTGGGVQLPFGRVELTIAFHSSELPDGSYGGQPNGLLLFTNEGKTIYHAGDTTVFHEMEYIGQRGIDLAMLPIGDYYTMGIEGSLQAIKLLKPKAVIPMHYNTFDKIVQDVVNWAQRVHNETDAQPIVLDPGGTHTLS
ncbi:MAG: metal-dependent hydrolase [Chloroflexi bacterium]|nr:metal-dependent hydrolase [Chloroflexota bacterium]